MSNAAGAAGAATNGGFNQDDITIADLVQAQGTSVRLRNCIAAALAQGNLPFVTVGEYRAAESRAIPALMKKVRSLGRKTAVELDELVGVAEVAVLPQKRAPEIDPLAVCLSQAVALLGDLTIAESFIAEVPSARLANAVSAEGSCDIRLADLLLQPASTLGDLKRRPNVGVRTLGELRQIASRVVSRLLIERGMDEAQVRELIVRRLGDYLPQDETRDAPDATDMHACVTWLIDGLREREVIVIRRRFGLNGDRSETLQEIATDFNVSRERIRQIEVKALRKMRARSARTSLKKLLISAAEGEWLRFTRGAGYLCGDYWEEFGKSLAPSVTLALEITQVPIEEWLEGVAQRRPFGWSGPPLRGSDVDEAASRLSIEQGARVPRPIGQGGVATTAAARAVLGLSLHDGYLMPRRNGTRVRRAVGLHSLLITTPGGETIGRLTAAYRSEFPHDPCSARDALIVMELLPHLFIRIADDHWAAIGSGDAARPANFRLAIEYCEEPARETIAAALRAELREGPKRLSTLFQTAGSFLPTGRSANSVAPTLISNPDLFERLLPGVYGNVGQRPEKDRIHLDPPDYLCDEYQLRLYVLARRAGESTSTMPLWGPCFEYALARWAKENARPELYRSLLSVANVNAWPAPPEVLSTWRETAGRDARYTMGCEFPRDAYNLPAPDRVLACAIYAQTLGTINWMAANRVCQVRLDATTGGAMLALLVAAGGLEAPAEGWQRPHSVTHALSGLVESLEAELAREGVLQWASGAGARLLRSASGRESCAWVRVDLLRAMTEEAARRPSQELNVLADLDDDALLEDVEELLPARMGVERGESLMDWLLQQ